MKIDRRTFTIVVIIVAIALPLIVLVFRKSFFPIIISVGKQLNSASILNGGTGIPEQMLPENVREAINPSVK